MDDLESQRQANIKRNRAHLDELGILYKAPVHGAVKPSARPPPAKRRKLDPLPPSRVSARIASVPQRPVYVEDDERENVRSVGKKSSKAKAKQISSAVVPDEQPLVAQLPGKDIETIRAGWTSWIATASAPSRDEDTASFHFADYPVFTPNKSPEEMLREGCFGGSYFRSLYSRRLATTIEEDYRELPASWYSGLDVERFLTSPSYDPEINKYKVKCGQSIEEWEAAGWMDHRFDVRGWFQWYCRFFMGRRCEDDERQVSRWKKCAGQTGRWRRALLKKYKSMGVREVFDDGEDDEQGDVSPVMHQTCFQWAYE